MTLDASGNWILGNTSGVGGTRAHIEQNSNANYSTTFTTATTKSQLVLRDASATGTYSTPFSTLLFGAGDSGAAWATITGLRESSQNSAITFGTASGSSNTIERARIDSSGNLLVGKTSIALTNVGFVAQPTGYVSASLAGTTSATDTYNVWSTGAAAYRFYVDMAGTIHATSVVITAISDERLKENVRDLDTGLDSIMALQPRRFDWKEGKGQDKKDVAGFIAQEFETVFPECVGTTKAGGDGIEYKNINHETLIPTLVKAIQEQQALITSLTARITALEGN
jgi:hypothetical protein